MAKKLLLSTLMILSTVLLHAQCNELFFSEYIEGSGYDKALEIYNPTNAAINLSGYKIVLKGFTSALAPTTGSFSLSGTIASKGTYVIVNSASQAALLAKKDTSLATGSGSIMNMNGDDALILIKNNIDTIDVIGNRFATDTSQAYTALLSNRQLIRKNTVNQGTSNWAVGQTQWNLGPSNSFSNLKIHTILVCGGVIDTILSFGLPTYRLVEENVGTVTIPLVSNLPASFFSIGCQVELISGDPADINGYTTTPVVILPSSTSANLNITVTDDLIQEGKDTLKFRIKNLFPSSTKLGADSIYSLVINVSDRPAIAYPIGIIRGMNTNGVPDSIDYFPIILKGVVYGNDLDTTFNGIRFVIRDNTGGILINSYNKNWNYSVSQGDTVMVQGRIGQISGWGTIDFLDTLIKFGSGAINAPVSVSTLDESTESNLIKLTNVYVSPCSPWPTSGTANVDVTDGIQNYTVRLTKAQNYTKPTSKFDLIGIGGQFDNSSPYTSGYQIFPRSNADFVSNGNLLPQYPLYSISTIKVDNNANGISDSNNVVCRVRGTVVGLATGTGATNVTIRSNGKGIKITSISKTFGLSLAEGDSIEAAGKVSDNAGWSEISANNCGDTVIKLGTGMVGSPTLVTSLGEINESDLVQLNYLQRVSGTWSATGNSNHIMRDASNNQFTVRILNTNGSFGKQDLLQIGPLVVIGIAGQFDTTSGTKTKGYQILPRKISDIRVLEAISLINSADIKIYPNPTQGILMIENKNVELNKTSAVRIFNTANQLVYSSDLTKNMIDINFLPSGNYLLEYLNNNEKIVKRFIKE